MHRFFKRLTGISLTAGLAATALVVPAGAAQAQQAGQPAAQGQQAAAPGQPKKQVKDQGEYDLFNGVLKATDPNEKLKLLNTWKEKYPGSDFKEERQVYFIRTYAETGKYAEAINTAKELLASDPKNITGMYFISTLTPVAYQANPPADALDTAEKAGNGLLSAEMPAGTKPEDWAKAKKDLETTAHKTLGWVAWQRKNFDAAEAEFSKSLELNPNQGEVSYWLGSALLQAKKPEKQAAGLYHIARAVVLEPAQGGQPDAFRKQLDAYLTKTYTSYHGSTEGLDQIKQSARTQPIPPAGFAIKSGAELAAEKEEEFKKSNPALALWMGLRKELTGPNGEQFFDSTMKNASVPGGAHGINKLKGKLLAAKPAVRSKELVVGVADPNTPEVTLRLETALTGKPVIGSDIEFEGVPVEFTKEPFMVTFDQAKVSGVQMEAPARKAPVKKGGARRK